MFQHSIQQLSLFGRYTLVLVCAAAAISPARTQAQTPTDRYDITGNGRVTVVDAEAARDSWADLQSMGLCFDTIFANRDVDGSGCVDVSDVQQILATTATASIPPRPLAAAAAVNYVVNSAATTELVNNSTKVLGDVNPGDGVCEDKYGKCNLRAAIDEANARIGPDRIEFNIRNQDGSCPEVVTIRPGRDIVTFFQLEDSGTTIDGYTQCGSSPNSNQFGGNAVIKIQLDGAFVSSNGSTFDSKYGVDGITIRSSNNVVRGLALYRWDRQILITGNQADYNKIQGNFLGTSANNTFTSTSGLTHHREGLRIWYQGEYNVIGCGSFSGTAFEPCTNPQDAYAARNIIAGNGNDGLHLEGNINAGSPRYNRIVGNFVGLKQNGTTALRNLADGIDFERGPQYNWLGGPSVLERNVISGNNSDGIEISHASNTQYNRVVGNYFGLDVTGTKAVPNQSNGISFEDMVDSNVAIGNYVSGNAQNGIRFYVLATNTQVTDNFVGVAGDGVTPLPNRKDGIYVMGGSQHNLLARNVIANSGQKGIEIDPLSDEDHDQIGETFYNTISQNSIYNNAEEGIDLNDKTIRNQTLYGNKNIGSPTILRASTALAVGTSTCANCTVELFLADKTSLGGDEKAGEGKTYLGSGTTGLDGYWSIGANLPLGAILTATITDPSGNTSRFATNIAVGSEPVATLTPGPTLGPTLTPTPKSSPTPTVTPTLQPGESRSYRVWAPLIVR